MPVSNSVSGSNAVNAASSSGPRLPAGMARSATRHTSQAAATSHSAGTTASSRSVSGDAAGMPSSARTALTSASTGR